MRFLCGHRPAAIGWQCQRLEARAAICLVGAVACQGTSSHATRRPAAIHSRVIVLAPAITDVVIAIGGVNRLVARTDFDRDPRVAGLPTVGSTTEPNLEVITDLRPDLLITWEDASEPRDLAALGRLGIETVGMRTSRLEDLRDNISRLGIIFDRREAAAALWRRLDDSLRAVGSSSAGRRRPRVLYVAWQRPFISAGRGSFIDTLISIAGGENVFHDQAAPWPIVDVEAAAAREPDVIVVARTPDRSAKELLAAASFQALRAVRDHRIIEIDADLLNRPGPRIAEAARALAEGLAR